MVLYQTSDSYLSTKQSRLPMILCSRVLEFRIALLVGARGAGSAQPREQRDGEARVIATASRRTRHSSGV